MRAPVFKTDKHDFKLLRVEGLQHLLKNATHIDLLLL